MNNQSHTLVAEPTHDGLGNRTGWHDDRDAGVEANTVSNTEDPWFQFVSDPPPAGRRITAASRASHSRGREARTIDSSPNEQFVSHNAGLAGSGGSSYLDAVILRDANPPAADWASKANGTIPLRLAEGAAESSRPGEVREERAYYLQNWRADAVALVSAAGALINQIRDDPHGKPDRDPCYEAMLRSHSRLFYACAGDDFPRGLWLTAKFASSTTLNEPTPPGCGVWLSPDGVPITPRRLPHGARAETEVIVLDA